MCKQVCTAAGVSWDMARERVMDASSSAIVELDVNARTGRAERGRIYKVVDPTGHNSGVEYVFNRFAFLIDKVKQWRNAPACHDLHRH